MQGSTAGGDGLLVCTDANFSGSCTLIAFDAGACAAFPAQFQNDVSTVSPPMSWQCTLYTGHNCDGDKIDVGYPGIRDLGDGNTSFNDRLNSFTCSVLG
ncbi:hypothetical protein PsYK624_034230 [Phanerochaete sordida]|uniref:Uncharacterized protein n=1 Tax=Phanerochaete sordida TaxID=48140 RepID=A0A9P3L9P0_9APHY|nr:hypothetical protein PsYK624_034230 [Phanerochaete sordida]